MNDCRTCKHNAYAGSQSIKDWVLCTHPITIEKRPRWERGDPQWIEALTGDIPISRIKELADCPTWEQEP